MAEQAYRARNPKASPLWQCLDAHFDTFLDIYPEVYEREYGFLRPLIPEVLIHCRLSISGGRSLATGDHDCGDLVGLSEQVPDFVSGQQFSVNYQLEPKNCFVGLLNDDRQLGNKLRLRPCPAGGTVIGGN